MAESVVVGDQMLVGLYTTPVAGVHRTRAGMEDLVVGFVEGMHRRVAAEGRCLSAVHYTTQTSILVVAAGGEVVGNKCCTLAARNRAGSSRMVEVHWQRNPVAGFHTSVDHILRMNVSLKTFVTLQPAGENYPANDEQATPPSSGRRWIEP